MRLSRDVVFDEKASWNWDDEPKYYKFLFFSYDHDESSDITSLSTPQASPITPQQNTPSLYVSSSERPHGMEVYERYMMKMKS